MIPTFSAKARENLRAAELLFESQLFNACANRAYYAALHAAIVALAHARLGIDRLDHGTIQARFSGELIRRRKVYPGRFASYLMRLQVVRDNADYKLRTVSEKEARRQLEKARDFVGTVFQEMPNVQ